MAGDAHARHDGAFRQSVAAKAGLVNAEVEQRGADVAGVALRAAVPHDPVNAARVDD